MSKFIPGSSGNVYQDIDGNDCSLYQMVTRSPEWACSRIREGEKAAAKLAELRESAQDNVDADIDCWAANSDKEHYKAMARKEAAHDRLAALLKQEKGVCANDN